MNGYGDQLLRAARLHPDRPAIVDGERRRTFGDLARVTGRLAAGLRDLGLQPGDRVVDIGDNRLEAVEIDFALARAGQVRVSLPELAPAAQHRAMVRDCEPTAIMCGPGWADYARDLAARTPGVRALVVEGADVELGEGEHRYADVIATTAPWDDRRFDGSELLSLRYTGGTTGAPKGVRRTHQEQVVAAASVLLDLCDLQQDDVVVHSTPLSHGANAFVLPALVRGALQVVGPAFDADATLALVERHRGTFTKVVPPTGIRALVEARLRDSGAGRDLSSLRMVVAGSAALPGAVLREAQEVFGTIIAQTYGQTESPFGIVTCGTAELTSRRGPFGLYPTGRPYTLTDVAVRAGDGRLSGQPGVTGEVVVRSAVAFNGYWGRDELGVDADGWRATGDVGCFDEDGFLYMLGRSEDLLHVPGSPITVRVVEEALYAHPAVHEAAVVELVVDGRRTVRAVVACRPGQRPDTEALQAACSGLPAAAVPETVVVVYELPKSPTGKILRQQAAALVGS